MMLIFVFLGSLVYLLSANLREILFIIQNIIFDVRSQILIFRVIPPPDPVSFNFRSPADDRTSKLVCLLQERSIFPGLVIQVMSVRLFELTAEISVNDSEVFSFDG